MLTLEGGGGVGWNQHSEGVRNGSRLFCVLVIQAPMAIVKEAGRFGEERTRLRSGQLILLSGTLGRAGVGEGSVGLIDGGLCRCVGDDGGGVRIDWDKSGWPSGLSVRDCKNSRMEWPSYKVIEIRADVDNTYRGPRQLE